MQQRSLCTHCSVCVHSYAKHLNINVQFITCTCCKKVVSVFQSEINVFFFIDAVSLLVRFSVHFEMTYVYRLHW